MASSPAGAHYPARSQVADCAAHLFESYSNAGMAAPRRIRLNKRPSDEATLRCQPRPAVLTFQRFYGSFSVLERDDEAIA